MGKVVIFIATSLDGYIATKDDDLSFLSTVEKEGEDYGYSRFIQSVHTVLIGRKTYDKVMSMGVDFPHVDKECFVITRTAKPGNGSIQYYTGNLVELVLRLKNTEDKNIFVDGGAELINTLLNHDLIDELIISVIPVLLGDGIPLFKEGRPLVPLRLIESISFESGLVQFHYEKNSRL